MAKNILILGATSAIARATAIEFAAQGNHLYLASRDQTELQRIAHDLTIRFGIRVHSGFFDAAVNANHEQFFQQVIATLGHIDGVVLAFGELGSEQAKHHFAEAEKIININFIGAVSILTYCANYFEEKRAGFIIAISSVAGDRGRQSNYIYGAAKGALSLYLQGLRNRLFPHNIRVITVKPGFVDTAMTFGMPGLFLVASPTQVGKKIVAALNHATDVVYIPWFWRYIMLIICNIPETIFKRLKL